MTDLSILCNQRVQGRRRKRSKCIKFDEHHHPTTSKIRQLFLSSRADGRRFGGGGVAAQCWGLVWIATTILCRQELCVESFAPTSCTPNTSLSTRLKVTQTNEQPGASPTSSIVDEEFSGGKSQQQQPRSIVSSNFWYTVVSTADDNENNELIVSGSNTRGNERQAISTRKIPKLPCVPTLDAAGPLPRGAYLTDHLCRIQVAWDVTSANGAESVQVTNEDITDMVKTMHRFTDAGLTSFQIKSDNNDKSNKRLHAWAERNIFGSLIQDTPSSVLQHCRLTVPLCLRDTMALNVEHGSKVTYQSTRSAVVESLGRMGSDCVDDLQIQFRPSTPTLEEINYYLDILDALQELQRDGLVRAVSGRNMSDKFLHHAQRVGLGSLLETNQINANLLNPDSVMRRSMPLESFREQTPLTVVANPLAGGWLTDRWWYVDTKKRSAARLYQQLSTNERACWKRFVSDGPWTRKHCPENNGRDNDFQNMLDFYQQQLLAPLQDIAHKHSASIAAVVLRWTLQMPQVAGTVATCRLLPEHHFWDSQRHSHSSSEGRIQDLRRVFRFELDEEDMERLLELSGHVEAESNTPDSFNGDRESWFLEQQNEQLEMEISASGLFIPRGDHFDNFNP